MEENYMNNSNSKVSELVEIQLQCDKIINLSKVLQGYVMDWRGQRIRVKFLNENKLPIRFMSGRYETMKERLNLMIYGLEEVHMRQIYQN